jgi:hypothetical protein
LFRSVYGQLPANPSFSNLGHQLTTWTSPKTQVLYTVNILYLLCANTLFTFNVQFSNVLQEGYTCSHRSSLKEVMKVWVNGTDWTLLAPATLKRGSWSVKKLHFHCEKEKCFSQPLCSILIQWCMCSMNMCVQ